ncbi:MAG: radical SAM protein, partial [Theionarchaea archaeon]|nr:radical SAM protein [Theionarchaea archaeon]
MCNLSCQFCFLEGFSPDNEIDIHDWISISSYMLENGAFKFSIAGVEPLLSPDRTFAILEHVKNHKRIGGFISNGTTPISRKNLDKIKKYNIVATFSIESLHPSLHDSMSTVSGSHTHCMHNIEVLLKEQISFSLQAYATRKNAPEIAALVDYCSRKGIAHFSLLNLMGGKWVQGQDFFDSALTPHEYMMLVDTLRTKDITVEYEHFNFDVTESEYAYNFLSHCTCSAGKTSITISPDGKAYPCP